MAERKHRAGARQGSHQGSDAARAPDRARVLEAGMGDGLGTTLPAGLVDVQFPAHLNVEMQSLGPCTSELPRVSALPGGGILGVVV